MYAPTNASTDVYQRAELGSLNARPPSAVASSWMVKFITRPFSHAVMA